MEYSRKKEAAFALIMMNGKEKDESFNVVNSSAGGSYQGILEFWEQDAELVKECAAKLDTAIGFVRNQGRLKYQFDHIYEEELALEDARIMALQSHINPHFMNNTLEIPEELYQEKVPRLILQPVIENAIAHGVQVQGTGKVRITGKNM